MAGGFSIEGELAIVQGIAEAANSIGQAIRLDNQVRLEDKRLARENRKAKSRLLNTQRASLLKAFASNPETRWLPNFVSRKARLEKGADLVQRFSKVL